MQYTTQIRWDMSEAEVEHLDLDTCGDRGGISSAKADNYEIARFESRHSSLYVARLTTGQIKVGVDNFQGSAIQVACARQQSLDLYAFTFDLPRATCGVIFSRGARNVKP
jgi:hypothetical protein